MNFRDIGIIISKRSFKENLNIISIFTKENGLYSAIVRKSSRNSDYINLEGNLVDFTWKARLDDHIGWAKCELIKSYLALLINNKIKLYAFNSIISLIKISFKEREVNQAFFLYLDQYLMNLANNFNFLEYIKCELEILKQSGYGLDLEKCVVTGSKEDLCFVSPKSGRSVSLKAGTAHQNKLLKLPKFFNDPNHIVSLEDKKQAFDLTSYFFNRYFPYYKDSLNPRITLINEILQ